ncbi:MAG: hypothetical protein K2W95_22640 [Candidatus Obscuribacterales bacterium]|nr:hypothetical protein [Candidatus Obscuribacterales bacterium]
MKGSFPVEKFGSAIMFTVLAMGLIGLGAVIPVWFIQWFWNLVALKTELMPAIEIWQALMLYLAGATILYLSGWIEIKVERAE